MNALLLKLADDLVVILASFLASFIRVKAEKAQIPLDTGKEI